MSKFNKKKSKRMTCRLKYKIIKKVSSHNRKLRRNSKKTSLKIPKDIGIPNSLPFKEAILREAEERKVQAKQLKDSQKKSKLKLNLTVNEIIADACSREAQFHPLDEVERLPQKENFLNSKTFIKDLKAVVEDADVILQVLDARDPLGTRSTQIEDLVIRSGKKLVLVMNKIDLIPKDNLHQWLKYLRLFLPTVAFKASSQKQHRNLCQSKTAAIHINESLQSSSHCVGAKFLMKVLGNYCRNQNIQTFIKVGVVGFPNVGKSSVINSLKRSRSCSVGATPGLTRSLQEVSLDKHIKIIDSPGVVIAKDGSPSTLALRNAVKVETLNDVITPAEAIIQRVDATQLCLHYTVPEFSTSDELLSMLAKRMGKYKRGGVPNCEEAAKRLIKDWTRGTIKHFTLPPESFYPEAHLGAKIVAEMSKAFDISALDESELERAPGLFPSQCVIAKPTGIIASDGIIRKETMEQGETPDSFASQYIVSKSAVEITTKQTEVKQIKLDELQQNRNIKKKFKKVQKKFRKRVNKAESASMEVDVI